MKIFFGSLKQKWNEYVYAIMMCNSVCVFWYKLMYLL